MSPDHTGQTKRKENVMTKFSLNDGESLFMEGYTVYMMSAMNVYQGDAYLTSERFVYCKKSDLIFYLLLGPLFGHLVKGKSIVFQFSLTELKSIHEEKHGLGKIFILTLCNGNQYAIQFGTRREKWVNAIKQSIQNIEPNIKIKEIGERIEFMK